MKETDPTLTIPTSDRGAETLGPAEPITLTREMIPWIDEEYLEVPTVEMQLDDSGTTFRYGSLANANTKVQKLASEVSLERSENAQKGMFKALNSILDGRSATNVERMSQFVSADMPVYKTAKNGPDVARLYFGITEDETGQPVVLKLGIAKHKQQSKLLKTFNGGKGALRKKDGGSR